MKRLTAYTATSLLLTLLVSGCSDKIVTPEPQSTTTTIIFSKEPDDPKLGISWIMSTDTTGTLNELSPGVATAVAPNRILTVIEISGKRGASLRTVNNHGNDLHYVFQVDSFHSLSGPPVMSADAKFVALVVRDSGVNPNRRLYTVRLEDSTVREISTNLAYETVPGLSADGKFVAYYETISGATSLVVARTDGSGANKIVTIANSMIDMAGEVVWHPNGNRLAYTDDSHLIAINSDGSNKIDVGEGLQPRWSPDGSKLAFVKNPGDYMWDIMITSDLGATLTNVTNTNAQWELYPQWSSDARYLVCATGTGDVDHSTYSVKLIDVASGASKILASPGTLPFFTR